MTIAKIEMGSFAYKKANKTSIDELRAEGIKIKSIKSTKIIDQDIADFLDENGKLVASFAVNEDGGFEKLVLEEEKPEE